MEAKLNKIFDLYEKYGDKDYIGENVSQLEHALQCASFAERNHFPVHVILGAFFHDIGHLVGFEEKQGKEMIHNNINYGPANHEKLGADFLRNLNVAESICCIVEGHVQAKRYLVFKEEGYYSKLSDASKQTLLFQGGPMDQAELESFEKSKNFDVFLKMRIWDDLAKDKKMNLSLNSKELITRYRNMLSELDS